MAYDRAGTSEWAWIKSVGAQGAEMARDWRETESHLLSDVYFSKHPRSIRAGDVLVYYAAGWGRFVALMQIESDEVTDTAEHPRNADRWRWSMSVRPVVTLPMEIGPTLAEAGIEPLRLRRQSHILLNAAEYHRIRDLMLQRVAQVAAADASGSAELVGTA